MKKLLLVIPCFLILGCENEDTIVYRTRTSNEKVVINNNSYRKVEVEGHDFYFRTWGTERGTGSDLVHNPNCKKCSKDEEDSSNY